jgi:hypothetical protein
MRTDPSLVFTGKPVLVSNLPTTAMVINFQDISKSASSELHHIAEWVEHRTIQEMERIKGRNNDDQKTRGDEISLLANFPESKPFWEDSFHILECFSCEFSQNTSRKCDKLIKRLMWTTKRIKKGIKRTHIIFFCPACTAGEPWIIHDKNEYTML